MRNFNEAIRFRIEKIIGGIKNYSLRIEVRGLVEELGDNKIGPFCNSVLEIIGTFKRDNASHKSIQQTGLNVIETASSLRDWNGDKKISCLDRTNLTQFIWLISMIVTPVILYQPLKKVFYTTHEDLLEEIRKIKREN